MYFFKNNAISSLLTILFIAFASGCVTTTPEQAFYTDVAYYTKSDQEAIGKIEQKYGGYKQYASSPKSPARGNDLLCRRYYRAGHYTIARDCYKDAVEANDVALQPYAAYEKSVRDYSALAAMIAMHSEDDYYGNARQRAAAGYFGLALTSLDIGDYTAALAYGEEGRKHLLASQYNSETRANWTLGTTRVAEGYSAASIAASHLGDHATAKKFVDLCSKLEFMFTAGFPVETTGDDKRTFSRCATAAFASGDLDAADELINRSVGGTAWRIASAIATFGVLEMMGEAKQMTDPWDRTAIFLKGRICEQRGDLNCAAKSYDALLADEQQNIGMQSIDTAMLADRPNLFYQVLYHRAEVALKQNQRDKALTLLRQSVDVIETLRSNINTETAKIGFAGDKQAVYAELVAQLVAAGKADEAFAYAERGKARALVDLLASKQQLGHTAQAQQTNQILAQNQRVEMQLIASANSEQSGQRSADRALIKSRINSLQSTQPELASLISVSAPKLAELQQRLPADETLLEYYGNDDQLYVFLLTRQGVGAIKLDGKGLADAVNQFRTALTQPDSSAYRTESMALYARLIAPVEKQLRTKNITLVAHGALHYLPFTALSNGKEYLIDRFAIRVLPSASVLAFIGKPHQATNSLLAIGNPDLKDASLDLPGAQVEATTIAQHQAGAHLLLRDKATETAIKRYGGNYRYLHFASHGMFDPDKPLESGLLLAADKENDGTLTVGELYNLNLNADLVTLSACETALGKISNGDDVVGFTRGFLFAGANSIVSSLWKVDDKATSELIQGFYRQLNANQNKRDALRLAQLQAKQNRSHPYYWAAFQITGAIN